ncbi:DUF2332 domain-containing protein [Bacillus massiliglaciei]|uniref:DUF2332 domain-containing protein n=1 Tax=Bacillus massiliglaciei TaxID=1816693 RepID=UPI000ADE1AC4|nr:DUF2332 domain-containing protein [Bacillus massiliglaciei]
METQQLSSRFKDFADRHYKGESPLYEFLSQKIAEDNQILELCKVIKPWKPAPDMLLGAVHYLLLKGSPHRLKYYYPSTSQTPLPIRQSFPAFQEFCVIYKEVIEHLLKTRAVQTNEIGRCAYLYPSLCYISEIARKPLALIEIGTGSGIQLLCDQFSYSYQTEETYGNTNSPLHISSEIRGNTFPKNLWKMPTVAERIGIDQSICNLENTEQKTWFEAFIWPEQKKRRQMLAQAASILHDEEVTLIQGDGIELLPDIARTIPSNHTICIFHTHVANHLPLSMKQKLLKQVHNLGMERNIFHLFNNIRDQKLQLDYYVNGILSHQTIAETDPHGLWFTWEL